MRNLTAGNKMNFTLFTFIILIIILLLVGALVLVLKNAKEKYYVESTAFMYDDNYDYIELNNPATISKKWTGRYYLKENVTNKEYELGKNSISFDTNKKNIELYGNFYQVLKGGDIKKISGCNKISNSSENKFYKIEDRKYLIVAKNINNDIGSLSMENYLIVIIDKVGNALLLNNETNIKTLNSIKLSTEEFTFDVANEKLIFNEEQIDLKKIIGSTNEYVAIENENNTENVNELNGQNDTNNMSNTIVADGSSTVISSTSSTVINNTQNSGMVSKLNEWATNVQYAFNSIFGNNDSKDDEGSELVKNITLNSIMSGSTYIDINYTVNDPENKYNVVYAVISNNTTSKTISLDKKSNAYRVEDLTPDTNYTVEIGYKIVYDNANSVDTVEDTMVARTSTPNQSLNIVKISSTKIFFNLKLDNKYIYDCNSTKSPKIEIYLNDNTKSKNAYILTKDNLNTAINASGFTGSFNYTEEYKSANSLTLKLNGTYYNGLPIETNLKTKIINY